MVAPVIPALTDHEMERILDAAKANGARMQVTSCLRLPHEVSGLFKEWLLRHYPDRYTHVLSLMRSMRGGKDYQAEWGTRMRGGPYAWQLGRRFDLASGRLALKSMRMSLRTDLFTPPTAEDPIVAVLGTTVRLPAPDPLTLSAWRKTCVVHSPR